MANILFPISNWFYNYLFDFIICLLCPIQNINIFTSYKFFRIKMSFPFVKQPDAMDCGPACLKMVAGFYKKNFTLENIRRKCYITREGVSFLGLSEAADSLGFRTLGVKVPFDVLTENVPLPCIVHWRQRHFIVVYKIKNNKIWGADPALGLLKLNREEFTQNWTSTLSDGKLPDLSLSSNQHPICQKKRAIWKNRRDSDFWQNILISTENTCYN
jgi:ABC-type bacteriocin/lantibiotic exporter with double-glycine peptidase domain